MISVTIFMFELVEHLCSSLFHGLGRLSIFQYFKLGYDRMTIYVFLLHFKNKLEIDPYVHTNVCFNKIDI